MTDRYQAWIEGAAAERPQLAAALAELGELYHKKLWHQLTAKLEGYLEDPAFSERGFLVQLYQNFVAGFAHKINLLKLAFFAVAVGKQMATPQVRPAQQCQQQRATGGRAAAQQLLGRLARRGGHGRLPPRRQPSPTAPGPRTHAALPASPSPPPSQEGSAFIADVIANLEASKQLRDTEQPILYLRMQLAQYALVQGNTAECRRLMQEGREELEGMSDVRLREGGRLGSRAGAGAPHCAAASCRVWRCTCASRPSLSLPPLAHPCRCTPRCLPQSTTPPPCTTSSRRSMLSTTGAWGAWNTVVGSRPGGEGQRVAVAWHGIRIARTTLMHPLPLPACLPLGACHRATLMYLAFVSQDSLPQDFRQVGGPHLWAASRRRCCSTQRAAPAAGPPTPHLPACHPHMALRCPAPCPARRRWRWTSRWRRCWVMMCTTLESCCCTPLCACGGA